MGCCLSKSADNKVANSQNDAPQKAKHHNDEKDPLNNMKSSDDKRYGSKAGPVDDKNKRGTDPKMNAKTHANGGRSAASTDTYEGMAKFTHEPRVQSKKQDKLLAEKVKYATQTRNAAQRQAQIDEAKDQQLKNSLQEKEISLAEKEKVKKARQSRADTQIQDKDNKRQILAIKFATDNGKLNELNNKNSKLISEYKNIRDSKTKSLFDAENQDLQKAAMSLDSSTPAVNTSKLTKTGGLFDSMVDPEVEKTDKIMINTEMTALQKKTEEEEKNLSLGLKEAGSGIGASFLSRMNMSHSRKGVSKAEPSNSLDYLIPEVFSTKAHKNEEVDWSKADASYSTKLNQKYQALYGTETSKQSSQTGQSQVSQPAPKHILPANVSEFVKLVNDARSNPAGMAAKLRQKYANMLDDSNRHRLTAKHYAEGQTAISEAAGHLQTMAALGQLTSDAGLCVAAHLQAKMQAKTRKLMVDDRGTNVLLNLKRFANVPDGSVVVDCNLSIDALRYEDILANLIIADGDFLRSSRLALLDKDMAKIGVGVYQSTPNSEIFCTVIVTGNQVVGKKAEISKELLQDAGVANL